MPVGDGLPTIAALVASYRRETRCSRRLFRHMRGRTRWPGDGTVRGNRRHQRVRSEQRSAAPTSSTGQVKSVDVGDGEILSADVKDRVADHLRRVHLPRSRRGRQLADRRRHRRGQPRDCAVGGAGRASGVTGLLQNGNLGPGTCNPESATFVNCDIAATITLSRPSRVLVIGSVRASPRAAQTRHWPVPARDHERVHPRQHGYRLEDHRGGAAASCPIAGVTGVFPAGQHSFGIDCNEECTIVYGEARVTAVALSDQ